MSTVLPIGEAAPWDVWPAIWPGITGPLVHGFPAEIETPELQRLGVGPVVTFRRWGFPVGYLGPDMEAEPSHWHGQQSWGLGSDSRDLDDRERLGNPIDAVERVKWLDVQRCIDIPTAQIVTTGASWELLRMVVPTAALGVVERLTAGFASVEALDGAGLPIYSYPLAQGSQPCVSAFVHPTPGVGSLTWRAELRVTESVGPLPPVVAAGLPEQLFGSQLLPPWADLRYGDELRFSDGLQLLIGARSLVRLVVTLFGPPSRFRVQLAGRLGGYVQSAGRRGAALDGATRRFDR
jgi:hypothetical protein